MGRTRIFEDSVSSNSRPGFDHRAGSAASFCELPQGNRASVRISPTDSKVKEGTDMANTDRVESAVAYVSCRRTVKN